MNKAAAKAATASSKMCVIVIDGHGSARSSACVVSGASPATTSTELSGAPHASFGGHDAAGASGGPLPAPEASPPRCREISGLPVAQEPPGVVLPPPDHMGCEGW